MSYEKASAGRASNRLRASAPRVQGASDGADKGLRRVRRHSELILQAAAQGIIGLDVDGRHAFVNPAAAAMLGYTAEDLLGRDSHSIWHHSNRQGDPYPKADCPIYAVIRDGAPQHVTSEVFWRKDGTCFPVAYKCTPIQEGGRRVGAAITFEDVTVRRETERALRESQARMAAALDVAELGYYEVANGSRVTYLDHRAREIIGASPADEEAGRIFEFWRERVHPEDLPRVMKLNRDLNEGELTRLTLDYRFLHPERGTIHIHHLVHVIDRDAVGRAVRTIGVLQDVTVRWETEKALRDSQARLASGVELAGLGFYELATREQNVTYVDDILRTMLGLPADPAQDPAAGMFWAEHIHPDDRPHILHAYERLKDGSFGRASLEYRYLHPDGGERWLHHLAIVKERDRAGLPIRYIGVIRDITDAKRVTLAFAQQRIQLAHMARVSTMGQLAFSLAHELN